MISQIPSLVAVLADAVIPNPGPTAPPGLTDFGGNLLAWGKWTVLLMGVLGLLYCAGAIIIGRRNRNQMAVEGVIGSVWVLGGLSLASVAFVLVAGFTL